MRSLLVNTLAFTFVLVTGMVGCKQARNKIAETDSTPVTRVFPGPIESNQESEVSDQDFEPLLSLINGIEPDDWREPEPFDPPLTEEEVVDVLQQCVHHVLSDPQFKDAREFYGTAGSKKIVLFGEWPKGFDPVVEGFELRLDPTAAAKDEDTDRVLGIGLTELDMRAPSDGIFAGNVELNLSNIGGSRNGMVIGGSLNYFRVQREGDKVVAAFSGSIDP